MPFIPPMLCSRLEDAGRLSEPRYVAEPKLDGQRAQLHVQEGRTAHLHSRPGRDLLRHPGMAWLREIAWPFASAALDGEAVAGDGHEGIQALFTERNRAGGDLAFVAFDVLELDGKSLMREPWEHRRKRLEDLFAGLTLARVGVVPVTEDAARLYEMWTGMGGEGIVLKDRASIYRPGVRSPAWLKLKPKVTLGAVVTGGSARPIPWGDWGLAVVLELRCRHPRTGKPVEIRQAVRVRRDEVFELRTGARAEVLWLGRDAEGHAAASAVRSVVGRSVERHNTSAEPWHAGTLAYAGESHGGPPTPHRRGFPGRVFEPPGPSCLRLAGAVSSVRQLSARAQCGR